MVHNPNPTQPTSPLRVGMHQLDLIWSDPAANLAAMERAWRTSPVADLHMFPEMSTTGFLTNAEDLARVDADASGAPYVSLFQAWARESGSVFLTSLVVRLNPNDFLFANRLFAVFPDGSVATSDKMHLFGLAGEDHHFVAGDQPLRLEWKGWRLAAAVCYDLRFPESYRNSWPAQSDRADYDLLCFVANWPDRRIAHWEALLPARAIENQAYVLGLNRVGADHHGVEHSGASGVWSPMGENVAEVPRSEAISVVVEVRPEVLHETRRRLPFLRDVRELMQTR